MGRRDDSPGIWYLLQDWKRDTAYPQGKGVVNKHRVIRALLDIANGCVPALAEGSTSSLWEERIRGSPQPKSKPTLSMEKSFLSTHASTWLTRLPQLQIISTERQTEPSSKLKLLRLLSSSGPQLGYLYLWTQVQIPDVGRLWICVIGSRAWLLHSHPLSKPPPAPLVATE